VIFSPEREKYFVIPEEKIFHTLLFFSLRARESARLLKNQALPLPKP
jgi:hypothetical protein